MKSLGIIALASSLLFSANVWAEEKRSWICVGEHATGFAFKNGKWRQTKYTVDGRKFLVRPRKPTETVTNVDSYVVAQFGVKGVKYTCDPYILSHFKQCNGVGSFAINTDSLRYSRSGPIGVAEGKGDNTDQPFIEIGTCVEN